MTPDRGGSPVSPSRWSQFAAMGTTAHVCVVGLPEGAAAEAASAAQTVVCEVEAVLSRFRADSDVGRLNAFPGEWLPVGRHLVAVAQAAARYRTLTRGAFDAITGGAPPGVGEESEQGGSGAGRDERLALRRVGEAWQARLAPGCAVDYGAIAKGYAADLARDAVRAPGVLVSLGTSSIAMAGTPPERDAWRVAIGSPWAEVADSLGYLEATQGSFSLSGVRGHRLGRPVRPGHVRDPRTGDPARTDACAVGVLSDDGRYSEALSTACLVLGVDRGLDLCHSLRASVLFLTASGEIRATPSLAPRLSLREGLQARLRAIAAAE